MSALPVPTREQCEAAILHVTNLKLALSEGKAWAGEIAAQSRERVIPNLEQAASALGYALQPIPFQEADEPVAQRPQSDLPKPTSQQPQSLETRSFDEPYALTDSPTEIFLGPQCEENCHEGRSWSVGDRGACEDCKSPSVKYIRADRIEALEAAELEQEISDQTEQERTDTACFGVRTAAQPSREAALVKAGRNLLIEAGEGNSKGRAIDLLSRRTVTAFNNALAAYDTPAKPDPLRQRDSVASAGREGAT